MLLRTKSVDGLILKKYPLGDTDLSVTLYTPKAGKIRVVAKGAKKITSKFTGQLELMNLNRCQIYSSGQYLILQESQVIKRFKQTDSLTAIKILSPLAEFIDKTTADHQPLPALFSLILKSLEKLGQHPIKQPLIKAAFKIKTLQKIGLLPSFNHCQTCRQKLAQAENYLVMENFSLMCGHCHPKESKNSLSLALTTCKLINFMSKATFQNIVKVKSVESAISATNHISQTIVEYQLGKTIRAESVLM